MLKWSAGSSLLYGRVPMNEARDEVECMTDPEIVSPGLTISRSLRAQSIVSLLLAGGLLMVGQVAAYSSMFGSLAAFIPALFFALVVTPKFGPDSAAFLRTAVMAEVAKIFLTALICVVVFVWVKPLAAGWFFTGMVVAIFSGRLGLLYRA
jgi:F0F1-type ATP synthase assembly protein I